MTDKTDKQKRENWLQRLCSGDHQAFAEFVEMYKGTVFSCCRILGLKEHEVEDVASETFFAAYKGISRYKGRAELSTWIWKIAYYKGISYLRKNNRYGELSGEIDTYVADSRQHQPITTVQSEESNKIIWETVKRLPRLWAVTVVLYYREEKSIRDIAKIIQVRQNTVKTYLFRARKKLKELLPDILGENTDVDK